MTSNVLRLPQVLARVGLSRSSVYARISDGSFPAPLAIGPRARGWLATDIDIWVDSRIKQRPEFQPAQPAVSDQRTDVAKAIQA